MAVARSIRVRAARCAAAGLTGAGITVAGFAAPAGAAPPRQDVQLPFPVLGIPGAPAFEGRDDVVSLVVPVPDATAPAVLRGTLQIAADAGAGRIDVEAQGRIVGSVEVPPNTATAPIAIPLAGVPVVDGAATLALHSHLIPREGWCAPNRQGPMLSLVDAAVDYTGDEAQPAVIADYLPPVLTRLTVYLPQRPSPDESATALEIGAAVAARYADQTVAFEVRPLGPGNAIPADAPGLLERRMVITESDTAATTLRTTAPGGPVLAVTGRGADLRNQARLITSNMAWIAADTAAVAGSLEQAPQLAPDSTTLGDLGVAPLTATGIGRAEVPIAIDQTRLGRASQGVRIHLRGNHTPLPDTQNGQIVVTAGDTTLAQWPVNADGGIDTWIDLPDSALARFTEVLVTLQVAGNAGCESGQAVTLSVDPAGAVTSEPAAPPVPGGFQALPQALMPTVQVGLSDGSLDDVRRALDIVTGLQRMTVAPLRPELVPFDEAASSGAPAVLIAAEGGLPDSIPLPLAVDGDTVTVRRPGSDAPAETVQLPGQRLGSVQTLWDGSRTLVVATSTGDAAAVDRILAWLKADPARWYGLTGDAVVQTGDREPVTLTAPGAEQAASGDDGGGEHRDLLIAGAVLLALGVVAALGVVLGRLRRGGGHRR